MIAIHTGRILVGGDALGFRTCPHTIEDCLRAHRLRPMLVLGGTRFYTVHDAAFHGQRMSAAFSTDRHGLQSLTLRRFPPARPREDELEAEFLALRTLASQESGAAPLLEEALACVWRFDGFRLRVALDPQRLDVGMFYAREGDGAPGDTTGAP